MKNFVLKTLSVVAGVIACLGVCTIDTLGTIVPTLMIAVGGAWCFAFYLANKERFER